MLAGAAFAFSPANLQAKIDAAAAKGGGKVTVPAGTWETGPLTLASGVELHLEEGAHLVFPDDPALYPVRSYAYEGRMAERPQPLVSAAGATNVAVTGKGTFEAKVAYWHSPERRRLPRPQFFQFANCANVRLEGFRVRNSPSWTIHMFCTDGVTIRGLDVRCRGPNTDGIDLDSVQGALIEDCRLDQGDDGFCMKSGRNAEGRRRGRPTKDVTIRNCTVVDAHTLLGIGSELSGGIENIRLENCRVEGEVWRVLFVKTNPARGGYVRNVSVKGVRGRRAKCALFEIMPDYQWEKRDKPTNPEIVRTPIENVSVEDVAMDEAGLLYCLRGDPECPPKGISLKGCRVKLLTRGERLATDIADLKTADVQGTRGIAAQRPDLAARLEGNGRWGVTDLISEVAEGRRNLVEIPVTDADEAWYVERRLEETRAVRGYGEATCGWENIDPVRREFPPARVLWTAALDGTEAFRIELRDGAEGFASITNGALRIHKTNADGYILVTAQGFDVPPGTNDVRLAADVTVPDADSEYSSGFLRAYGRKEILGLCHQAEREYFSLGGGHNEMRGLACTAPSMTYRKYAHSRIVDGHVTPVVVVAGAPSISVWRNWTVEDVPAAKKVWEEYFRAHQAKDHADDRIDEASFDTAIAADTEHSAEIRTVDGFSRLFVDGKLAAPVVYKGKHAFSDGTPAETFAGKAVQTEGVRLMVKEVRIGWTPGYRGFWTKDGFDLKGCVTEITDAMRIADKSLFIIAFGCTAYPEFTIDEHPEETWRREDGSVVEGTAGSCTAYKAMGVTVAGGRTWPWVSYASRVWREEIKDKIRRIVAELKAQGLAKRIVGAQMWGYHDGQFTAPIVDFSRPAQEEYKRFLAEPDNIATNYHWFVKQIGFRAQEEFARTFKQALGKPAVVIRWCEVPLAGTSSGACDLTAFMRSDAVDVIVAQPNYTARRPGFAGGTRLPSASFHLHRKMYWDEFDLRTYGALEMWASTGIPAVKGLGTSEDFPMWQTVYRKHAGTMLAQRMGWWFYDMGGGWCSPPEIAADIGLTVRQSAEMAAAKPSAWKPGVAVVIDEAGLRAWTSPTNVYPETANLVYKAQSALFASAGVPFDVYLADDFLRNPSLADSYRMVVMGFFMKFDGPRRELVRRIAADGRTVLFLAESGIYGGADATGFDVACDWSPQDHNIKAEPGVAEFVRGLWGVWALRQVGGVQLPKKRMARRRMSVAEGPGVKVFARYVSDGRVAIAARQDDGCRRIFVGAAGGITPALFNRFAHEAGAYVGLQPGVQLDMNGDFASLHCLRPGRYHLRLPYPCRVVNMKSGAEEKTDEDGLPLELTAGETCWFRFIAKP